MKYEKQRSNDDFQNQSVSELLRHNGIDVSKVQQVDYCTGQNVRSTLLRRQCKCKQHIDYFFILKGYLDLLLRTIN